MKTEIERLLDNHKVHGAENKLITKALSLVLRDSIKEAYNNGYYRAIGYNASKEDIENYIKKKIIIIKEDLKEVRSNCLCGEEIIVSYTPKFSGRKDGKRVYYPDHRMDSGNTKGCVFRCRKCGNVISDTCYEARYENPYKL